jgi:hypothetical protein
VPRSLVDARRAEAERLRRNVDGVTRDEVDNELDRKVLRLPGDPWHNRRLPLVGRNMIGGAIGTVPRLKPRPRRRLKRTRSGNGSTRGLHRGLHHLHIPGLPWHARPLGLAESAQPCGVEWAHLGSNQAEG